MPPAQAMPTLKVAKTLWGVDEAADTGKWDALFARIKAEGFDGVEAIAPTWRADPALFTSLLTKHGLALICQIHTTGGDIVGGEYVYCSSCKLDDHVASFEALGMPRCQGSHPRLARPRALPWTVRAVPHTFSSLALDSHGGGGAQAGADQLALGP